MWGKQDGRALVGGGGTAIVFCAMQRKSRFKAPLGLIKRFGCLPLLAGGSGRGEDRIIYTGGDNIGKRHADAGDGELRAKAGKKIK